MHIVYLFILKIIKENEQIKAYTKEGKKYEFNTNSQLFHYVKDFDYSKVDFDNPPKRQKKFKKLCK